MYAYNFEYDGKLLSDFGFIICHFDQSSGASNADAGSEINFTTASSHSGKRQYAVGTAYKQCLSTTFQICKDPHLYNGEIDVITAEEFRNLSRWLLFHAYDWCEPEVKRPWVRASFSLRRIDVGGETVGIELEATTDSPFGYGDEIIKTIEFEQGALEVELYDRNDEIGDCYPELTVTCGASGTWSLDNDITGCHCEVKNCVSDEVLTFSGESMIIGTSSVTHELTLANDFNYDYFRFANTIDNRENIITASMPCVVELRYRPILKDTM